MFYTILESNLVGKKSEQKFDPLGGIFTPPPRENRQKNSKNGLKWQFLPLKWRLRHAIHCKSTFFWCEKPNLEIFSRKFMQKLDFGR